MSGSITKLLFSISLLATAPAFAMTDDMGDENYPVGNGESRAIDDIKAEHDAQMQKMDDDYSQRMESINKRYTNNVLQAEERKKELMKKRAEIAKLNLERTNKRAEMEKKMREYKGDLANRYEEHHNPFVEKMREEGRSYGNPLEPVSALDMEDQGGLMPSGDSDDE